MFKKLMCLALSIMMVLCTIQVTGFAADYSQGDLVASHVTFTAAGGATINVENVASEGSATAVFWLGEYVDGILVESDFVEANITAGQNVDLSLAVTKDTDSILKAYIWEGVLRGKAIAPVATYPSSSTEINYVTKDGEIWADFNADTTEYSITLPRTEFNVPQFAFYAADNSTVVTEPAAYAQGANKITVTAADGTSKEYTINISYESPTVTMVTNPDNKIKYMGDAVVETGIPIYTDRGTFIIGHVGDGLLGLNYFKVPTRDNTLRAIYAQPGTLFSFTADSAATVYIVARAARPSYVNAGWELISSGKPANIDNQKTPLTTNSPDYPYWSSISQWATDAVAADWQNNQLNADGTVKYVYKNDKEPNVPAMQYPAAFQATYKKEFKFGELIEIPTLEVKDADYDFVVVKWADPEPFDMTDDKLSALSYTVGEDTVDLDVTVTGDEDKVYNVDVPTGTDEIAAVSATLSTPQATLDAPAGAIALVNGAATAVVKVTSFDGENERTYTINFTEIPAAEDNADIKSISYTAADGEAVEIEGVAANVTAYTVTLPAFTAVSDVKLDAQAIVGNTNATVEVAMPEEWVNNQGSATITITSKDTTVVKTYTVNFIVELDISEKPNKIYDLTSQDKYKTANDGYQTEEEAVGTPGTIVIGENLSTSSFKYHDRAGTFTFAVTDDMLGASYIRTPRNHSSFATILASEAFTRTVEGSDPQTLTVFNASANDVKATGFGFRSNSSLTTKWYSGAYSAQNGEPGWIEFYVSSDCTVVVGDSINAGWPNLDKTKWTAVASDATTNKVNGTSYYRAYKAGDLVQIPNYGIGAKLADDTKVTYNYKDQSGADQVYETTLGADTIYWDEIVIAVKWDTTYSSDNSLASITANGVAADLSAMVNNNLTVTVPVGTTSVKLVAAANHTAATVTPAEADVAVGDTVTFTVTAENGDVAIYTVTVVDESAAADSDATLKTLSYSVDGALTGNITLEDGVTAYSINVPSNADAVTITAEPNSGTASAAATAVNLADAAPKSTVTVTAKDGTKLVYTVNVNVASVPFINIASADSGINAGNTYKVYDAKVADIHAQTYSSTNADELTAKKAEYNARLTAFNEKYGTNAARGTTPYNNYPFVGDASATSVKIDNPLSFGHGQNDAHYIIDGDSWVFRSTKGGTPTATNPSSFGKNDEYLTFDVSKPGTMYVMETNGWGYKGGTDIGYVKVDNYTLGGCALYAKHFEAGKVIVPAQNSDKYTIGTRQPNSIGFVFMFDDESNADVTSITYKLGDTEGSIPVILRDYADGTPIEIGATAYTGAVEITTTTAMAGTTVTTEGTLTAGNGTITITATAPDGEATKVYKLNFTCEPYKIINGTKGTGAAWVTGMYGDATANLGAKYAVVDGLVLGTTKRYADRVGVNDVVSGSANLAGATYIRTPKNEAGPGTQTNVPAYGGSFTVEIGDAEPVSYATKLNGYNGTESNIGFRAYAGPSWEKAFFSGAYDGKNGNPYWVTFVPTSDCTVIIGDGIRLDNVAGYNNNQGYPNLDKSLWKNNTGYNLIVGTEKTYVRHFKAGEIVEIPNYGLGESMLDTTPIVYTYTDKDGVTQTFETTVRDNIANWEDLNFAIVWDDKAIDASAWAVTVDGEAIADFSAAETTDGLTVTIPAGTESVELGIEADYAATVTGLAASYKAGDTAVVTITAGDGTTTKTYTFKFVAETPAVDPSVALTSVTYGDNETATLKADGSYYIEVASEIASVTITATAEAADAVVSYAPSNTVALEAGVEKIVTVTVTAGEAVENYTVKILRKIDSVIGGIEDGGDIGNN